MAARLGELERNELEFAEVAGVVANHRNAAAILAETTMKRLSGNKIDDELAAELNKLKVATDKRNKFLSNTKSRAERLGDILKYLTDDRDTRMLKSLSRI